MIWFASEMSLLNCQTVLQLNIQDNGIYHNTESECLAACQTARYIADQVESVSVHSPDFISFVNHRADDVFGCWFFSITVRSSALPFAAKCLQYFVKLFRMQLFVTWKLWTLFTLRRLWFIRWHFYPISLEFLLFLSAGFLWCCLRNSCICKSAISRLVTVFHLLDPMWRAT